VTMTTVDTPVPATGAGALSVQESDVEVGLEVGIDPVEGQLVCKFNLFVMPGMPRSWIVLDTKRWKMMATCCGDLGSCSMASYQSLLEYAKGRPFVYVTTNGEPPEIDSPPFTAMFSTGFVADCDPAVLCDLCKVPGVRAIEIRRQRVAPLGYRVRIFHDGTVPPDPSLYIDPSVLYEMAQTNAGGRSRAGSKAGKKKKTKVAPEEREAQSQAAALKNEEYIQESTREVAQKLGEDNTEVIGRAVRYAGMSLINKVVDDTLATEASGGMMTADGSRRRKTGGVFLQLLQQQLSAEQYMLTFQRMPSPNLIGSSIGFAGTPPQDSLGIASSAPSLIPTSGRMLDNDSTVQLSTSLGSSPKQSLLSGSVDSSFNVHAAVFVPSSGSLPNSELTLDTEGAEPGSVSSSLGQDLDDDMMFS